MDKKPIFTDYLSILYKWKKFLIINILIVAVISTTISLLIPETFKSTSKIILAPQNSMGMGGLGSLLSDNSALSFGAKLLGVSSSDEDLILGLLSSRTIIEKVVNKFNLYEYYDEKENKNFDKLIKKMTDDLLFEPNEYGMIEISVINENPKTSSEIANYFVYLVDSVNIDLGRRSAKNNRVFIERRYNKNISDLKNAEDSMYRFQKEYGIFAVPEQLEASVKAAAEIEAMLVEREIMLQMLKETSGEESPKYQNLLSEVNILRKKVNDLKYSDKLSSTSNVLFPFQKVPDIIISYYRLFREVEIQSKIMEFTLPMFEQAKVDENKSTPTLLVIDKAVPAQLKYAPKKAFIILASLFLFIFLSIIIVFRGEQNLNKSQLNTIEIIGRKFYKSLKNIYKIT